MSILKVFPVVIGLLVTLTLVSSVSVEEDLTLTAQQKRALDRFKTRVVDKLPEKHMKHDIYLIRFLRAKSFDVSNAEQLILEDVKWRRDNNMKTIIKEDFSDIEDDGYRSFVESFDREGKPIITANFGSWDLRKAVATGKMRRLERYIDKQFEVATSMVRDLQGSGKNITQWNFIINMNSYNILQHGCVACVPFYVYLTNTYEKHYPGYADKIMLINTPPVFEAVLNIIRPLMSPITRRALKVYNQNREQWEKPLFKYVDPSELPPEYGGTKIYSGTA